MCLKILIYQNSLEDADDNPSFEVVDIIKPEPIKTPKISDTVAQAIKFIEETNIKEEIENSDETSVDDLKGRNQTSKRYII